MLLRRSADRPWSILVVDRDLNTLEPLLELLRGAGDNAAGTHHLDTAIGLIRAIRFDVMVAGVRPRSESTLDLIRLAREEQPEMGIIALTAFPDSGVEHECERLGVAYVLKPLTLGPSFLRIVERVGDLSRRRRWTRKPVLGGLPASVGSAEARLIDMSYGGFCLQTDSPLGPALPAPFTVRLPSFGLSVNASIVWMRQPTSPGPWLYGAALGDTDEGSTRAWRGVVDALPAAAGRTLAGM